MRQDIRLQAPTVQRRKLMRDNKFEISNIRSQLLDLAEELVNLTEYDESQYVEEAIRHIDEARYFLSIAIEEE
jgi:hypothetical protein